MEPVMFRLQVADGEESGLLHFYCKARGGDRPCSVPISKNPRPGSHHWQWNGEHGAECTIIPSVNCKKEGCGLHFTINDGAMLIHG